MCGYGNGWDRHGKKGKKEIRRRRRKEGLGFICVVVGMGGVVGRKGRRNG